MESKFLAGLKHRCQKSPGTVVLPEQDDIRILQGAELLLQWGAARNVILFDHNRWRRFLHGLDQDSARLAHPGIQFAEDLSPDLADRTLKTLHAGEVNKGRTPNTQALQTLAATPLYQAAQLVNEAVADAAVAGALHTTGDVIKAALRVIGLQEGIHTVSGSFIMRREREDENRTYLYADSGVVIDPTIEQLVEIATESVRTWQMVIPAEGAPVVAFLSFSTKGSAQHPCAAKMAAAAKIFQERNPTIVSDGEMQFDAAFDYEIGIRKSPASKVPGQANIFIFPNLDAGNIAYKITERLAGFAAYGPLLQGLRLPFSDLSRGCNAQDVAVAGCISLLRAGAITR